MLGVADKLKDRKYPFSEDLLRAVRETPRELQFASVAVEKKKWLVGGTFHKLDRAGNLGVRALLVYR